MRYIGIDFGSKRIGVAISDEAETLAFPHGVIQNGSEEISKAAAAQVAETCKVNGCTTVVMGESKNYKGEDNTIMPAVRLFTAELEKLGLTVVFEPEMMSTMQAERIQGKREDIDASAAAVILQSFLDRNKNKLNI